jgi:hypothetical protein
MSYNASTGKFEGEWHGRRVIVDGDTLNAARNALARDLFGISYFDTDEEQEEMVDRTICDPGHWAETDANEAKGIT